MVSYSSWYEILNVPEHATLEQIKSAFRKLALIHHPDKNNNSPESQTNFIIIHNAYSVLSDPVKRGEYDAYLRTSAVFKNRGKATSRAALPGIAGSPYGSLDTVFSQLNFVLWEVEDFLRDNHGGDWNREYAGKPLRYYVLKILIFIDKWILEPTGYPDYFREARQLDKVDITESIYRDFFESGTPEHRAFFTIEGYFYNIRIRVDKLLTHARLGDMIKTLPELELRVIDCIFEAQNLAVHYLSLLRQVMSGKREDIPPFHYSHSRFGS